MEKKYGEVIPKKRCEFTVLVSSCDAYEDLWNPFFSIIKKEWPEVVDYPIVLNTESKAYTHDGLNIKCYQLYKPGTKVHWGKRLIDTLNRVEDDYVLFLLDDFFLTDRVNYAEIVRCYEYMRQDKNIAVFYFVPSSDPNQKRSDKYLGYAKRSQNGAWKLNTQAALWRKDKLISYIRPHESAWEWEVYGSQRSSRYLEDFYAVCSRENRAFQYRDDWGGAIHRGRWTPYAIDLLKKNGFAIDVSIRGIEDEAPPYGIPKNEQNMNRIQRMFRPPFFKRLKAYVIYLLSRPREWIVKYKSLK